MADGRQEKVVREKLKAADVNVLVEGVYFGASVVVDEDASLLGGGKHVFVVQPLDVPDGFAHVYLGPSPTRLPVKRGQVPLATTQQQMPVLEML